jgi:very-short-patch-repair endonuclease/uncharacterized protein YaiI (UPF0178 family)
MVHSQKTMTFIEKASRKHGDTYSYENVKYVSTSAKIKITCESHGDFEQTPASHLSGNGCSKCSGKYHHTTESFIAEAIKIHGDKYSYEKVNYIKAHTKIKITCKSHGDFEQIPTSHLSRKGCSKCSANRPHTTESFIVEANKKHENLYSYEKAKYVSSHIKIKITCESHGDFEQTPASHLNGSGCIQCGGRYPYTTESFIAEAIKEHGDRYSYKNVDYINNNTKIKITCKKHGSFEQTPGNHLSGQGCRKCGGTCPHTTESFIAEAIEKHGDRYSYKNVDYINAKTKIKITCKKHEKDFEQTPDNHLSGQGCRKCGGSCPHTTESFIAEAIEKHGDRYSYKNVDYINTKTKIKITCKKHEKDFEQTPNSHLSGNGCPLCVNKTENKLYNALGCEYNNIVQQFTAEWCMRKRTLPFDFCIPEYKMIIELDGAQHFRQVKNWQSCEETVENDRYKSDCANKNNYSVIRLLQEDVWDDKYNWIMELHNAIKRIRASGTIMNIYLCKNDEYAEHTAL